MRNYLYILNLRRVMLLVPPTPPSVEVPCYGPASRPVSTPKAQHGRFDSCASHPPVSRTPTPPRVRPQWSSNRRFNARRRSPARGRRNCRDDNRDRRHYNARSPLVPDAPALRRISRPLNVLLGAAFMCVSIVFGPIPRTWTDVTETFFFLFPTPLPFGRTIFDAVQHSDTCGTATVCALTCFHLARPTLV